MEHEENGLTPESGTASNEWGSDDFGGLDREWREVSVAGYAHSEGIPEWASVTPAVSSPISWSMDRGVIPDIRKEIGFYRQAALPVVIRLLQEYEDLEMPVFSQREFARQLLAEFEDLLNASHMEISAFEAEYLGNDEFNGKLSASETAHELALTEVMAAEAIHAEQENEAQSLMAGALPISIAMLSGSRSLKGVLPSLTRANAKLVSGLFRSHPSARRVFGLLPSVHRRAIAALKVQNGLRKGMTPAFVHRLLAAQTLKTLSSPGMAGKALVRNRAIRQKTMPPCGQVKTY